MAAEQIETLKKLLLERESELEASDQRFRNVINRLGDAVIIVDKYGTVQFVNAAAVKLFGRKSEELIGAAFGLPIVIGEMTEIDLVQRGGEIVVAEMCMVETEWEGEKARLASLRDITDRKRAERERAQLIREQAARVVAEAASRRLAFLADASAALASSLDYETTLASVARLVVPFLADYCIVDLVEEDGLLRQVAVAHIDPSKEELLREARRRYPFDMEQRYGVPNVLRTAASELVPEITDKWINDAARDNEHAEMMRKMDFKSYIVVPLIARERTLGAISLVISKSDRRYHEGDLQLAEDLARRAALAIDNARLFNETQSVARLKDEFLTTLSHELRTPLTSVLGWVRILRSPGIDQETIDSAVGSIERNARQQAQLILDILDVSSIITGKLQLKIGKVRLKNVINEAIQSVTAAAEAKSIEIVVDMDESIEPIQADHDRLRQVVWNLLSNAVKFTPNDGRVSISVQRNGAGTQIKVSDTGVGIRREFLPFVFERFRQADGSSTREHGGLGLGLALVRHLVEMHGGTVVAESGGISKGATFTIHIPSSALDDEQALQKKIKDKPMNESAARDDSKISQVKDDRGVLFGLRVLVVDDEPDTRDMLFAALTQYDAEVLTVASANEALESLSQWRPNMMIADIGMPYEDGYDLIRKVRSLSKDHGGNIPAIAVTAYARSEDRERALAAGYQRHVPKPVEPDALVKIIAELV